jgi:hypothetical protein
MISASLTKPIIDRLLPRPAPVGSANGPNDCANQADYVKKRQMNMMQMSDMSTGMMLGCGLIAVLVLAFLILGIAASIKYLRS